MSITELELGVSVAFIAVSPVYAKRKPTFMFYGATFVDGPQNRPFPFPGNDLDPQRIVMK